MPKSYKSYIIPFVEIASKSLSVISIFIITRLLTQEDFGEFNYINSIVLVFSVFLDLGINSKAYTLSLLNKNEELNKLFYTRLLLSLIILGLFNLFLLLFTHINILAISLYSMVIWSSSLIAFLKLTSRGMGFFKMDALSISIEPILRVVFLSIIYFNGNLWEITNIYLLFLLISSISLVTVLIKAKKYFDFKWSLALISLSELRNTIYSTRHFIFYYLFLIAIQRVEIFFIKERFDFINVAIYFSAFNLILAMQLFFRAAVTSRYKQLVDKKIKFGQFSTELGLSLLVVLAVSFFMVPLVFDFVYPEEYVTGIPIFKILLLQLPFYTINVFIINQFNIRDNAPSNTLILGTILVIKLVTLFSLQGLSINVFAWVSVLFELVSTIGFVIALISKKINPQLSPSQYE